MAHNASSYQPRYFILKGMMPNSSTIWSGHSHVGEQHTLEDGAGPGRAGQQAADPRAHHAQRDEERHAEIAPDAGQGVADPEVEHQIQDAQYTAQPDGLEQKRDKTPDLAVQHIGAAQRDEGGKLPVNQQHNQPRHQLADQKAVDEVRDAEAP